MLMKKIFNFTVNDIDVENHCERKNNQDHTIITDNKFDTTTIDNAIIDNKFYTACTTYYVYYNFLYCY